MELIVLEYSLTLSSRPVEDQSPVVVPSAAFESLLNEPIVADEGDQVVSVRDQLSLVVRPPLLTIIDYAGAVPARTAMIETAAEAMALLANHGLEHETYGWNVRGSIDRAKPERSLHELSNHRRIADAIGGATGSWGITQIDFSINAAPEMADQAPVSLKLKIEDAAEEELGFEATKHYHRPPDAAELQQDGARMWDATSGLIKRLLS